MSDIKRKPLALIVLDGWGWSEIAEHNAIHAAKTPFFDNAWATYPHTFLHASAENVGLPPGQMGNSEVGHMTIGAGKVIDTDLVRISKAALNGEFEQNPALKAAMDHVRERASTLHILGLVSPGGIHSHSDHLYALLDMAKQVGITQVAIHVFTDGRDTLPQSAAEYIEELEQYLEKNNVGSIVSVAGRYYAMDRDRNWDRLEKVEKILFSGSADQISKDKPSAYIRSQYDVDIGDEYLPPIAFPNTLGASVTIKNHDAVVFFNFRADRARMMAQKIEAYAVSRDIVFATFTQYEDASQAKIAFPPVSIETTLAKEISAAGLTQVHIAETEKYAHATYFLNGGVEKPYPGEEHILIESRKDVATHDLAPRMRAQEIADKALEHIDRGVDFIFINFANADMVGHTARREAIIEAIEEVDTQLYRFVEALLRKGGAAFITADHGNAEQNVDAGTGEPHTAHTSNIVPAILTIPQGHLQEGSLADVTPTVLHLLDVSQPASMTGKNLLQD